MNSRGQKKIWLDPMLLLVSLIMSLLVWGYVDNRRVETKDVKVPLSVEIPGGWEMDGSLPEFIEVRLQGPREQMKAVSYSDLKIVKRISERDVSGSAAGGQEGKAVNIIIPVKDSDLRLPQGVVVVSLQMEAVNVNLARLVRQYVRVKPTVVGSPPDGYHVRGIYADPNTVQVTVPEGALNFGDTFECYPVDVSSQTSEFYQRVGVKPRKLANGKVLSTNAGINVSVIIEPVPQTRKLEKIPVRILYGLALKAVKVEPSSVSIEVEGPKAEVDSLKESDVLLYVDMKDVTGDPRGEHKLRARVLLPSGISTKNVEPAEVTVTVK